MQGSTRVTGSSFSADLATLDTFVNTLGEYLLEYLVGRPHGVRGVYLMADKVRLELDKAFSAGLIDEVPLEVRGHSNRLISEVYFTVRGIELGYWLDTHWVPKPVLTDVIITGEMEA